MEQNFTLATLLKHLMKNLWLMVGLAILGGGGMYVLAHQAPKSHDEYKTARLMYIQNSSLKSADPKSRVAADAKLIQAYVAVENNQAIVRRTLYLLDQEGITNISYNQARNNTELKQKPGTVAVWANAKAGSSKQAVALTNAYAEAFASIAPRLIPNMPKPVLMPATGGAAKESNASKPIAPKKAAIFGAGAGFGIGVVLTLFTGIIANLRSSKRQ